jgi:hypothetical protein
MGNHPCVCPVLNYNDSTRELMMKILRSNAGFSLVSVLVAIGMTGILATILMNLTEQQTKQQKKAVVDGEMNEVVGQIRSIFSNEDSCNATLVNKKRGQDFLRLMTTNQNGTIIFEEVGGGKTDFYRGTKLKLIGLRILSNAEVGSIQGLSSQTGVVVVQVELQKPEKLIGGKSIKKNFEVRVLYGTEGLVRDPLSATGVVTNCKSEFGPQSFIKDLKTGKALEPEEDGVFKAGQEFLGMCVREDETNPGASVIHCIKS